MLRLLCILTVPICFLFSACNEPRQDIQKQLIKTTNYEESKRYAEKARKLGLNGIPIFLEVISVSIQDQDSVPNYGKLTLSINNLYNMAKEGISSEESVPVLLDALESQRSISDSLITANTIKIITGLDVGYDLSFVKEYTDSDEPRRKKMIEKWRSLPSSEYRKMSRQ